MFFGKRLPQPLHHVAAALPRAQPVSPNRQNQPENQKQPGTGRTRHPCLVGPAAVYPAPPNHPPLHGPRVHRRSAASPAAISRSTSTRARTQVRPGRSCRARRWSAIGQRRRRSAAVSPCRRHSKREHDVIIISPRSFANHPLVVVLILLFRPPQDVAPSASAARPPRHRVTFVVVARW